jgi:hypothetical protein
MGFSYRVKRDGFDPIWVTTRNFVKEWFNVYRYEWNR